MYPIIGTCQLKTISSLILFFVSLSATHVVRSDDIAVFGHLTDSQKPNILFVLDYSTSMQWDTDGKYTSDTGNPSRISILRNAMTTVLNESEKTINAGLSFFHWTGTGIKWPISDLEINANLIDPSIPASAGKTAKDVLIDMINTEVPLGSTATVHALMEAALYFRGESVTMGGVETYHIPYFKPPIWNNTSMLYEDGHEYAANPITYTPRDAYNYGVPAGVVHSCDDYTVGGLYPGEYNDCEDKPFYGCVFIPEVSGITPPTETDPGGPWTAPAYNACKYEYPDSWAGANYNSPISNSCQENVIVLVSDGTPTILWDSDPLEKLLGHDSQSCEDLSNSIFSTRKSTDRQGNCGPEIVKSLFHNNQISNIPNSNVKTYTVGFKVESAGKTYLNRLASEGGGRFFSAESPDELTNAFKHIIREVLGRSESFAELSIDIDRANFSDDNRVFFPLFTPSNARSWQGNLKGYFIDKDGLKDVNNVPATVTTANGTQFKDTTQSFWSEQPDGNQVKAGGASALLKNTQRNLYTFTDSAIGPSGSRLESADGRHDISVNNTALTNDMLGLPSTATTARASLINWVHDAPLGDPLHARALPVKYDSQTVVYTMTNQGFLHAFDATHPTAPGAPNSNGGEEIFAFMPAELLGNLIEHRSGASLTGQHIYGLDGGLTRWHEDNNKDGIVNGSDTLMLIFGMRRGGKNYYALDVTNPADPILKWRIRGGHGDFTKLAQSWSRMSLLTVNKGGSKEKVLVFGGGYDANVMDGVTERTPAGGNTIYMIDRHGKLIWSASHWRLEFSIPSDVVAIDSDENGLADRLYVGDLGGQVWRVDFDDINQPGRFVVTRLAHLGEGEFRPIFYPPSVALNGRLSNRYFSVVVGTGNRTNPMRDDTYNLIAMLKDTHVDVGPPPVKPPAINLFRMYDATANAINSNDPSIAEQAAADLAQASGWYINLASGEKMLSSPVSFEGRILATTFHSKGAGGSAGSCSGSSTEGRYYDMSIRDASPTKVVFAKKKSGVATTNSAAARSKVVSTSGIPNSPIVVFPKDADSAIVLVDRQTVDHIDQRLTRVYWNAQK